MAVLPCSKSSMQQESKNCFTSCAIRQISRASAGSWQTANCKSISEIINALPFVVGAWTHHSVKQDTAAKLANANGKLLSLRQRSIQNAFVL